MATERDMLIWATFARLEDETGNGASLRAVGRELGISAPAVQEHVWRLVRDGHLKRLATGGYGTRKRCRLCRQVIEP